MSSTTLVTFRVHVPQSLTYVHLFGSWDNFSRPYTMKKDSLRSHEWRGCHTFTGVICDGEAIDLAKKPRDGGLKMGGRYWYYYQLNGDVEYHNPAEPSTKFCPLLPGQEVNVMDVPIQYEDGDTDEHDDQAGSAEHTCLTAFTMNPEDKYTTPEPPCQYPTVDTFTSCLPAPRSTAEAIALCLSHPSPTDLIASPMPDTRTESNQPSRAKFGLFSKGALSSFSSLLSSRSSQQKASRPAPCSSNTTGLYDDCLPRAVGSAASSDRDLDTRGCPAPPGSRLEMVSEHVQDYYGSRPGTALSSVSQEEANASPAYQDYPSPSPGEDCDHPVEEICPQIGLDLNETSWFDERLTDTLSLAPSFVNLSLEDEWSSRRHESNNLHPYDSFRPKHHPSSTTDEQMASSGPGRAPSTRASEIFSSGLSICTGRTGPTSIQLSQPLTPCFSEFGGFAIEDRDRDQDRAVSDLYRLSDTEQTSALTLKDLSSAVSLLSKSDHSSYVQRSSVDMIKEWDDGGAQERKSALQDLVDDMGHLRAFIT